MKDLRTVENIITLGMEDVLAILKKYIVSVVLEDVEIIGKSITNYENGIDDVKLELTVKKSTKIFNKKPEFKVTLSKLDILDCLNDVLRNSEEVVPYKIENLVGVYYETGAIEASLNFQVKKIYSGEKKHTLEKKMN